MNKVTLDSSFICALVNKNDVNHKRAFVSYEEFGDSQIFIPQVVLLELAILRRKQYRDLHEAIYKFLEIIQYKVVAIQIKEFEKFIAKTDYNLKPNDYFILFASQISNAKLLTFDEKLSSFLRENKSNNSASSI